MEAAFSRQVYITYIIERGEVVHQFRFEPLNGL